MEPAAQNPFGDRPDEIAPGVFWVGFFEKVGRLHCNPYLIVDRDTAVLIDGGSRPDFPDVMAKILQTGVQPHCIKALIFQHYDPDLCGGLPNFEDIIGTPDLLVLSSSENNTFIRHYGTSSRVKSIETFKNCYRFPSGRTLQFHKTPYSHSAGSFVTLDAATGVLFSSDLFGSYGAGASLFLQEECGTCMTAGVACPHQRDACPVPDIERFHRRVMTSTAALRHSLAVLARLSFSIIAPQHGSIVRDSTTIRTLFARLRMLEDVGIDGVLKGSSHFEEDASGDTP